MEIREERNRIEEIHALCSKSFEHHHKDSTLTEEEKELFRGAFSEHALHVHMYTRKGNPKPWNFRFVCEIDGKIVGTIDLYQKNMIRKLYIDPDHLNKGIASALIQKVIDKAKELGEEEIFTYTATMKGIPFFEKHNFLKKEKIKDNSYKMTFKLK